MQKRRHRGTKVSVVIPTLNEEPTIGPLIDQLRIQTIPPDEIIVVDGISKDKTVQIARKKNAKTYQKRSTIGEARHHGTQKAKGNIVIQTDGDVENISPKWIQLLTQPLRNKTAVVTTGNIRDPKSSHLNPLLHHGGNIGATLLGRAPAANLAYTKNAYQKTPGFPDADACEDHDLILQLREIGNHVHIERPEASVEMQVNLMDWARRVMDRATK